MTEFLPNLYVGDLVQNKVVPNLIGYIINIPHDTIYSVRWTNIYNGKWTGNYYREYLTLLKHATNNRTPQNYGEDD